jgi:hypothetical protein
VLGDAGVGRAGRIAQAGVVGDPPKTSGEPPKFKKWLGAAKFGKNQPKIKTKKCANNPASVRLKLLIFTILLVQIKPVWNRLVRINLHAFYKPA